MNQWQRLLVTPECTLKQAIQAIDEGACGAVIVVDDYKNLVGTVTDGDVRRAILRNAELDTAVKEVMCETPHVGTSTDLEACLLSKMQRHGLHQLPIINDDGQVIDVKILDELVNPPVRDNVVVIMAGGLGKRLRPLTENCPKPLLKIQEKPVLEHIILRFKEFGYKRFILTINYHGQMIRDYFKNGETYGIQIDYIEEQKPLGTAGALSLLPKTINDPFFVINGDIVTQVNFHQLMDFHCHAGARATLCVREYQHSIPYGVVRVESQQIASLEEKPVQYCFVNAGIYVLNPSVLSLIPTNHYYDMPELMDKMLKLNYPTSVFPIREYWTDIGKLEDFQRADREYSQFTTDQRVSHG